MFKELWALIRLLFKSNPIDIKGSVEVLERSILIIIMGNFYTAMLLKIERRLTS
nr:MAG TPA: hypothetical protein [Crassvirales sp.]